MSNMSVSNNVPSPATTTGTAAADATANAEVILKGPHGTEIIVDASALAEALASGGSAQAIADAQITVTTVNQYAPPKSCQPKHDGDGRPAFLRHQCGRGSDD
jgi:hypothetical protein